MSQKPLEKTVKQLIRLSRKEGLISFGDEKKHYSYNVPALGRGGAGAGHKGWTVGVGGKGELTYNPLDQRATGDGVCGIGGC